MEIVQGQAKTWLGPDPKDSKWCLRRIRNGLFASDFDGHFFAWHSFKVDLYVINNWKKKIK